MAMNRRAIDEVGYFDPAFGLGYGEESQWCMRANKLGWKHIWQTGLFVYHKHGVSFAERLNDEEKSIKKRQSKELFYNQFPEHKLLNARFNKQKAWVKIYKWVTAVLRSNFGSFEVYFDVWPDETYRKSFSFLKISSESVIWEVCHNGDHTRFSFDRTVIDMAILKKLMEVFHVAHIWSVGKNNNLVEIGVEQLYKLVKSSKT